jgi:hypothetical protein
MWLFTRRGFYSVSRLKSGQMQFRVRRRAHLEHLVQLIPGLLDTSHGKIIRSAKGDYPWRLLCSAGIANALVSALLAEITWEKVKPAIREFQGAGPYVDTLLPIWQLLLGIEDPGQGGCYGQAALRKRSKKKEMYV